jgi:hypothetical protein
MAQNIVDIDWQYQCILFLIFNFKKEKKKKKHIINYKTEKEK